MDIRDLSAPKHRALNQMKQYWSTSIYNYPPRFPLPSLSEGLKGFKLNKNQRAKS